jgi:hypothetical protein
LDAKQSPSRTTAIETKKAPGKEPHFRICRDVRKCVALDCHTVSYCCRGRWPFATARSRLPDSPPDCSAWDCSPPLSFALCAGMNRTCRFALRPALQATVCLKRGRTPRSVVYGVILANIAHYRQVLTFLCRLNFARAFLAFSSSRSTFGISPSFSSHLVAIHPV